jgi:hypothetical protein
MTVNEHGQQTIKLVKPTDATPNSAAAALATPSNEQLLQQSLFTPATAPASAAAVAAVTSAGPKRCSSCEKTEAGAAFAACGRCGAVWYCNKDCQKAHWCVVLCWR